MSCYLLRIESHVDGFVQLLMMLRRVTRGICHLIIEGVIAVMATTWLSTVDVFGFAARGLSYIFLRLEHYLLPTEHRVELFNLLNLASGITR